MPHVGPDIRVLYVNRKMLRDAGIDPSDDSLAKWAWTDMVTHHQKMGQQQVPAYAQFRKIADTGGSYAYLKNADFNERVNVLFTEAVIDGKRSVRDALLEGERLGNQILQTLK